MHRILRYETDDGEERFAVWSTVVDGWITGPLTERQLVEWYLGRQAREAHEHITGRIDDLRDGENPYRAWDPEEMRERLPDEAGWGVE